MAIPPASRISRSAVLIVDWGEFGFGGKGTVVVASEVDLAARTTESHKLFCSQLLTVQGEIMYTGMAF